MARGGFEVGCSLFVVNLGETPMARLLRIVFSGRVGQGQISDKPRNRRPAIFGQTFCGNWVAPISPMRACARSPGGAEGFSDWLPLSRAPHHRRAGACPLAICPAVITRSLHHGSSRHVVAHQACWSAITGRGPACCAGVSQAMGGP